jgi:hypothetical protein
MKTVCISLDFELRWGVRHLYKGNFLQYKKELDGADDAAKSLCDYFDKNQIPSSWATVGALALSDWDEFFEYCSIDELNLRSNFIAAKSEFKKENEKYYFSPNTVTQIASSDFAELASHTFTHLFCCEPNITEQMFILDNSTANDIFLSKFGHQIESLVFPRNQENFLYCFPQLGLKSYRANEVGDSPESNTLLGNTFLKKVQRFSSSINPFLARSSAYNSSFTRASLFLRLDLPSSLWRLHLARIKNELKNLSDGECFHIWCHPHNLGADTPIKLKRISEIMDIIFSYRDRGDLEILSMNEIHKKTLAYNSTL